MNTKKDGAFKACLKKRILHKNNLPAEVSGWGKLSLLLVQLYITMLNERAPWTEERASGLEYERRHWTSCGEMGETRKSCILHQCCDYCVNVCQMLWWILVLVLERCCLSRGGIPIEELGKITDAFYMVDKSRSRKEGGSGLGLALCVKVAEIHGGCLKIESRQREGTTVRAIF